MNLYSRIKNFVDKYKNVNDFNGEISKLIYRNTLNPEDQVDSLDLLFERKANLQHYCQVQTPVCVKEECLKDLTSFPNVKLDPEVFQSFYEILSKLKLLPKKSFISEQKEKSLKIKTPSSPFKKALNSITAAIYNAENKGKDEKAQELRRKRVQLYIDHQKVPTKRFLDYNLYLEMKDPSRPTINLPTYAIASSNNYNFQLSQLKKRNV